ncbi:integral membrane protein [Catenulispora acidiphila DSM 44928]|uniref:Integral membrane protein n=1 Tax=Catenulispora acidiphila (strain DSM 44928 / JCM 14897 / NBRC 102108 / NRRL B-24433 / ID139908) TaxID=479433 RepID=C7Q7J5_CATAD|nr:thioredoxin domain-containing protein [Catenulispora acidiphila]ACU72188.1 integral membrane protein [Catenulispora acidiphila DSM 44928]
MSQRNSEKKQSARERVEAERLARQRRGRRRRQFVIITAVLVVLGAATGVGIAVSTSSSKPVAYSVPTNGSVVADKYSDPSGKQTALAYGPADAPHTLTIYEDFRCPICRSLETGSASVYKSYVAAGTLRVLFHPVTLIDANNPGTSGSLWSGAASVCAAAAGKFDEYHDALYADQPDETTDGYSDIAKLISVAKQIPGLDSPTFESCVTAGTYKGLVQQNMTDFNTLRLPGTPTLLLDGKRLTIPQSVYKLSADGKSVVGSDPAQLKKVLQAAGLP